MSNYKGWDSFFLKKFNQNSNFHEKLIKKLKNPKKKLKKFPSLGF